MAVTKRDRAEVTSAIPAGLRHPGAPSRFYKIHTSQRGFIGKPVPGEATVEWGRTFAASSFSGPVPRIQGQPPRHPRLRLLHLERNAPDDLRIPRRRPYRMHTSCLVLHRPFVLAASAPDEGRGDRSFVIPAPEPGSIPNRRRSRPIRSRWLFWSDRLLPGRRNGSRVKPGMTKLRCFDRFCDVEPKNRRPLARVRHDLCESRRAPSRE